MTQTPPPDVTPAAASELLKRLATEAKELEAERAAHDAWPPERKLAEARLCAARDLAKLNARASPASRAQAALLEVAHAALSGSKASARPALDELALALDEEFAKAPPDKVARELLDRASTSAAVSCELLGRLGPEAPAAEVWEAVEGALVAARLCEIVRAGREGEPPPAASPEPQTEGPPRSLEELMLHMLRASEGAYVAERAIRERARALGLGLDVKSARRRLSAKGWPIETAPRASDDQGWRLDPAARCARTSRGDS